MSMKTQEEKIATTNESTETEGIINQKPTILTYLVVNVDEIIRKRRGETLREVARKNGLKLRLFDAWRNETPKINDLNLKK